MYIFPSPCMFRACVPRAVVWGFRCTVRAPVRRSLMSAAVPKLSTSGVVRIRICNSELGTTRWKEGGFEIHEKDSKVNLCLKFNSGGAPKIFQVTDLLLFVSSWTRMWRTLSLICCSLFPAEPECEEVCNWFVALCLQLNQNVKNVALGPMQSPVRVVVSLKDSSVVTFDRMPTPLAQKMKEYLEKLKQGKPSGRTYAVKCFRNALRLSDKIHFLWEDF